MMFHFQFQAYGFAGQFPCNKNCLTCKWQADHEAWEMASVSLLMCQNSYGTTGQVCCRNIWFIGEALGLYLAINMEIRIVVSAHHSLTIIHTRVMWWNEG